MQQQVQDAAMAPYIERHKTLAKELDRVQNNLEPIQRNVSAGGGGRTAAAFCPDCPSAC